MVISTRTKETKEMPCVRLAKVAVCEHNIYESSMHTNSKERTNANLRAGRNNTTVFLLLENRPNRFRALD